MAFDITGASAYVDNNSKEISLKTVANSQTAKLLLSAGAVQTGVKGKSALLMMDSDEVIQDGSTCGRTPLGDTVLTDKFIEVKPLKSEKDYCTKDLHNKFFNKYLAAGQAPAEEFTSDFISALMEDRIASIAEQNEKMIWQGDTSLTGTTNLNHIDGFVTIITGNTATATGSTMVEKMQSAWLSVPAEHREKPDFRFFIGEDTYGEYLVALANKNIYKPTEDRSIFGTTGKFEVVAGLNGVNKVYATRISNLRLGIDATGDDERSSFEYSIETKKYYSDVHYSLGVQVARDGDIWVGSL